MTLPRDVFSRSRQLIWGCCNPVLTRGQYSGFLFTKILLYLGDSDEDR